MFYQLLYLLLSYYVNVGCRFIKDHNLVFPQNCTADAQQLLLASTEIGASLRDFEVDALPLLLSNLAVSLGGVQVVGWL